MATTVIAAAVGFSAIALGVAGCGGDVPKVGSISVPEEMLKQPTVMERVRVQNKEVVRPRSVAETGGVVR